MKMDADNRNDSSIPVFIDASGEAYYQQNQVAEKLVKGVRRRFPNLFRRCATPEEIPILKSLGMKPRYSRNGKCDITLLKVNEVNDLLEQRTEKYKAVPRSKELLFGAGSEKIASPSKELRKPSFSILQLISQALLSSENSGLTAREIVDWISNTYPYYQSVEKFNLKSTFDVLSRSKCFTKNRSHEWHIVQEYETRLRENAYLSKTVLEKKQRSKRLTMEAESSNTFESLRPGSKLVEQAVLESTAESSEIECVASYPIINATIHPIAEQENQPVQTEASSSQMNQERLQLGAAIVNPCNPQETIPDVLSTISAVENGAISNYTSPLCQIKPEIIDTINLIEDDATTVYISPPQEIKQEVSQDDIIDLTSDELEDQSIDVKHQPEWKINPIKCPITINSMSHAAGIVERRCPDVKQQSELKINPIKCPIPINSMNPAAGIVELRCPLCGTPFPTKEALGEHVITHRKAPPTHVTETVKGALQSVAPSLLNGNREATIFVFSGNVYLSSSNTPATS